MVEEVVGGVVPIINLKESPFPYAKLRAVCEEWGCFRVVNHLVPTSLMAEMKVVSRSMLDLPIEIKNRQLASQDNLYVGYGERDSILQSFGLGYPSNPQGLETFCSWLNATSQQRETIEKYAQSIDQLIVHLTDKIAESVGVSETGLFKNRSFNIRMDKYTFSTDSIGSYGVNSHTDPGFLTVLQDDEVVGGLEVAGKNGSFITVKPYSGSFFINLGDMAVAWSNGRFPTVKHRVLAIEAAVRVSIVSFVGASEDSAVEAPPELVDSDHPRLYVPIQYEDYRKARFANGMNNGEALELSRFRY